MSNHDLLDWHNDQDAQRRNRNRRYMDDLENSDLGRSDRFPPGWFILPSIVLGCVMWYFIVKWIMGLIG